MIRPPGRARHRYSPLYIAVEDACADSRSSQTVERNMLDDFKLVQLRTMRSGRTLNPAFLLSVRPRTSRQTSIYTTGKPVPPLLRPLPPSLPPSLISRWETSAVPPLPPSSPSFSPLFLPPSASPSLPPSPLRSQTLILTFDSSADWFIQQLVLCPVLCLELVFVSPLRHIRYKITK